jgi:hypothetical protein
MNTELKHVVTSKMFCEENPKRKKFIVPKELRMNRVTLAYKEGTSVPKFGSQCRNDNVECAAETGCKETPKRKKLVYDQRP